MGEGLRIAKLAAEHSQEIKKRQGESRSLTTRLAESEARERELRQVCAEAYQLAGAYNASVEALDNLSAAAVGKALPHKTFLPVINIEESERVKKLESDYNAVRDYADELIAVGWCYRKALEYLQQYMASLKKVYDQKDPCVAVWDMAIDIISEKIDKALADPAPSEGKPSEG